MQLPGIEENLREIMQRLNFMFGLIVSCVSYRITGFPYAITKLLILP